MLTWGTVLLLVEPSLCRMYDEKCGKQNVPLPQKMWQTKRPLAAYLPHIK